MSLLEEMLEQFGDTDYEVIEKIEKHLNGN